LNKSVAHCNSAYLNVATNPVATAVYDEYATIMEDFISLLRAKGNAIPQYPFYKGGKRSAKSHAITLDDARAYKEALAIAHEMVEEASREIERRKSRP
jgi:hypothetical protein